MLTTLRDRLLTRLRHIDIDLEGDLYLRRWWLLGHKNSNTGALMLHKMYRPDADRCHHDHPWPFTTLVLWGGYTTKRSHSAILRPVNHTGRTRAGTDPGSFGAIPPGIPTGFPACLAALAGRLCGAGAKTVDGDSGAPRASSRIGPSLSGWVRRRRPFGAGTHNAPLLRPPARVMVYQMAHALRPPRLRSG